MREPLQYWRQRGGRTIDDYVFDVEATRYDKVLRRSFLQSKVDFDVAPPYPGGVERIIYKASRLFDAVRAKRGASTCPHCTLPVADCECHERGRD